MRKKLTFLLVFFLAISLIGILLYNIFFIKPSRWVLHYCEGAIFTICEQVCGPVCAAKTFDDTYFDKAYCIKDCREMVKDSAYEDAYCECSKNCEKGKCEETIRFEKKDL